MKWECITKFFQISFYILHTFKVKSRRTYITKRQNTKTFSTESNPKMQQQQIHFTTTYRGGMVR